MGDELETGQYKGAFIKIGPRESLLPPAELFGDAEAELNWCKSNRPESGDLGIVLWKLVDYNLIETKRSDAWFQAVLPRLKQAFYELTHFDVVTAAKEDQEKREKREKRKREEEMAVSRGKEDLCGSDSEEDAVDVAVRAALRSCPMPTISLDLCGGDSDEERE